MERDRNAIGRREVFFTVGALGAFVGLLVHGRIIERDIADANARAEQAQAKLAASCSSQEAKAAMREYTQDVRAAVNGVDKRGTNHAAEAAVSAAYLTGAILRTTKKA